MIYPTHKGKTYTVTTTVPCTITNAEGMILCTAQPAKQASFVATGAVIHVDCETAEITDTTYTSKHNGKDIHFTGNLYKQDSTSLTGTSLLNMSEGDARWKIHPDNIPTQNSENAVSSGGLYNILYGSAVTLGQDAVHSSIYDVVIGREAYTTASGGVAIGYLAVAAQNSVAVGYNARSSMAGWGVSLGAGATVGGTNFSVAIGSAASTTKSSSQVIGNSTALKNEGVTLIGTWDSINRTVQTLFYIIAAGSELAEQYEGGAACLGYVIKESNGNVLACGTRKLSELLTNNTAFAPAALDLDTPAPQPFLPNGVTEPIELEKV